MLNNIFAKNTTMKKYSFITVSVLAFVAVLSTMLFACNPKVAQEKEYNETTKELIRIVEENPQVKMLLTKAIEKGKAINPDKSTNPAQSLEEYYDFVEWLQSNHYWRELISDVYVQQPKHLLLSQRGQKSKIVLGALDGYADKLSRLRTLFTHGLDEIEHPEYREYDLRFDGQVVGRK